MNTRIFLTAAFLACIFLSGCDYDFPLTTKPTRSVDPRLLGDWMPVTDEEAKDGLMHVRDFDGTNYAVSMDKDVYRAFHSDFANVPFLSVQDLNSSSRKYLYFKWSLSDDGTRLSLQAVDTNVIPETTRTTSQVQRLIKRQSNNPQLFRKEIQFTRKQSAP